MNETKQRYAKKSLIHVTDEQKKRMAEQAQAKVQAHVNELNQVQARRFELASALLIAKAGYADVGAADIERFRMLASTMVDADAREKWTALKTLFVELEVPGPQAPLERAAAQVGVTLFDVLPEEPESLVLAPSTEELLKVSQ